MAQCEACNLTWGAEHSTIAAFRAESKGLS
jgi:hypothetical protein